MKSMTFLKNTGFHKILLLLFIIMAVLVVPALADDCEEELETALWLLKKANDDRKENIQQISDLLNAIEELEKRIAHLEAENAVLQEDLAKQTGWYAGAMSGYPFPQFNMVGMYKFKRWGIIATTGYINGFNLSAGFLIHFHE